MGMINLVFLDKFFNMINTLRFLDIIDIAIVAVCIYKLYMMIKETRAEQLVKGLVIIFIFVKISDSMKLYTVNWVLENMMTALAIMIIVVFQPELRKILETIGRSNILTKSFADIRGEKVDKCVEEIVHAVFSLSRQRIGALIIFERSTGLGDVVETGTVLNSAISSELLINIFIPNTPLHDGAVVIKNDTIKAAACFLPLSTEQSISKELGTRHRAAIGMSEKSDCLALIVSEETGGISIAEHGKINRYVDEPTLTKILTKLYNDQDSYIFNRKEIEDER
ncbi:diadenylate cyclase CdaA [Finegoldia magna]|uniref:Diadenylate cyclase n=3 Tax=Finegoldia magna TaxID=1260 RepID=B0S2Q3_FINM2|nr:diadenylate cyclase CdaA [Finegoldia magna]EFK94454.1 TIGR00159 family protein [Finegoldia magna ACS-171-V-Col3]EFL54511.1 TIGR00159 family protein [Finegoldia magna BVS033A4]EGS31935.1 TIGR00159 family protein [Finegoldia magna SY403409CC001050417]EXF26424.1 membrane protein [Finegoldia magna ALB8]KXA09862.1 TIGR00159 family protein [Finegoldia magna]